MQFACNLDFPLGGARFGSGREAISAGLPGRVLVSPPVWLCCVYPALRRADRLDAQHEASRLGRLLQAAANAWRRHVQGHGNAGRQCVFPYEADDAGTPTSRVPIRVELVEERPDHWTTRLELAAWHSLANGRGAILAGQKGIDPDPEDLPWATLTSSVPTSRR